MRIRDRSVFFSVVYINVIESDQIEKVRLVDHAQAEQLADTWLRHTVLELGQPAVGDTKALVAFSFGDAATGIFDVANSDVALMAQAFKLLTCRHSCPHKSFVETAGPVKSNNKASRKNEGAIQDARED